MMLEPLYACLEKNQAEEEKGGNNCPGINKCEKLPVTQVQCLQDLLLNLFSQEQGTQGNEKKQQFVKEYKEKVRFSENSF